jgi:D-3-phosphoglycerate dehydrogenase
MKILISDAFDPSLPEKLSRFGEVTEDKDRLPEMDVALVRSKTKCTKEWIDSAGNMKIIIRGGVGIDNIDTQYAASKGILVRNTAEASTVAVAEQAFAFMIALTNHLTAADRSMREHKWLKKELKRRELMGKTLGILGLGRIGTALAIRCRAFGMRVLGGHPDVYFSDFAVINNNLQQVLAQSDFVSLHMPLVDETRGFINRETLGQFKTGAYLVNTARAGIIVEEDLVEALRSGQLAGYATDVWPSDPPPWDGPLFEAPNTLFSPHIGASTRENLLRIGEVIEKILDEYLSQQ